jgi:hypothetical protein
MKKMRIDKGFFKFNPNHKALNKRVVAKVYLRFHKDDIGIDDMYGKDIK